MGKKVGNKAFTKLSRLLRLVRFIAGQGAKGATWDEIREKIYEEDSEGASDASLYRKFCRDQEDLADYYADDDDDDLGYPEGAAVIVKKKDYKGDVFTIRNGLNLMLPMKLTEEEALALMSGVRLVSEFIRPLNQASNKLWQRLKNQINDDMVREQCELLTEATVSAIPVATSINEKIFMDVLTAISEKMYVEIDEYSVAWANDLESCIFAPYVIYLKHHSWYVLGEVNGERKILRMDRIKSAILLDDYQENPLTQEELEALRRDISLDYNPFDENMPEEGWNIKLRITGSFVKPCLETEWFPNEKKDYDPESKSVIYTVNLKGLEAITLWIMRALDCMEVLEPTELRDIINKRVDEYMKRRKRLFYS